LIGERESRLGSQTDAVRAYGWAFASPARKVYYNITVTSLSVAVALAIGLIELLQVSLGRLHGFGLEKLGTSSWASSSRPRRFYLSTGRHAGSRSAGVQPFIGSGPTSTAS
jgi:hypothetical protein